MLKYNIINNKPTIQKDNVQYIDLLADVYDLNGASFSGYPIVVEKYYVARPDLISLAVYGTDEYADVLCKLNGISNPFEVNEGDIVIIPSLEFVQSCFRKVIVASETISNVSTDKIHTIEKGIKKETHESRSPNEQTIHDKNYIIDNSSGLIFY